MSRSLRLNDMDFGISTYAEEFALLRPGETNSAVPLPWLGRAILEANLAGLQDVIATEGEICLIWARGQKEAVLSQLESRSFEWTSRVQTWSLPVWFEEHDDWKLVCKATGLSREQVIAQLLKGRYPVAMLGFLPGFVYLHGLNESLHVPRKATPTTQIKERTLAIGGKYLGLYSLPTPAGWHAIGRVSVSVLDMNRMPPVCVSPGDVLQLKQVDEREYEQLLGSSLESFQESGQ